MPKMMPKLTILAVRRMSGVTSSLETPKTRAAVAVWMSAPMWKASIMAGSPLREAMTRSSIWL